MKNTSTPKNVQCLLLPNFNWIIADVQEVSADIGDPDCLLKNPYLIVPGSCGGSTFHDLLKCTDQDGMMIRSSDVLTFVEPKLYILDEYEALLNKNKK